MGKHKTSAAYGVRLPHEVWSEINSEAASLGMTRNEWLYRKLITALRADRERGDSAKVVKKDEVVDLP